MIKRYAFEWVQGGYNYIEAKNTREAYDKAADLGGWVGLVPNRGSFTSKPEFIKRLEEKWKEKFGW